MAISGMTDVKFNNSLESIIRLMEDSPFEFHLVGSRAFGLSGVHSDYDFMTGTRAVGFLFRHGFIKLSRKYNYQELDVLTIDVLRKFTSDGYQIDVQITSNVELKLRVFEFFKENKIGDLSKDARLWNALVNEFSNSQPKEK